MTSHSAAYYREWRRRTGRTKTSKAFLDGLNAARQAVEQSLPLHITEGTPGPTAPEVHTYKIGALYGQQQALTAIDAIVVRNETTGQKP